MKKVGRALETVIDVGNTILWPLKFANERTRLYFEHNIRRYQQKLEQVPDERITQVAPEIAVPVLQRLEYVSNKHIADAFVKLLAAASDSKTVATAHPGFIALIDRIAPDEAIILSSLLDVKEFPGVRLEYVAGISRPLFKSRQTYSRLSHLSLSLPDQIPAYLDNLQALGLILRTGYSLTQDYSEVRSIAIQLGEEDKIKATKLLEDDETLTIQPLHFSFFITSFGQLFIRTCLSQENESCPA